MKWNSSWFMALCIVGMGAFFLLPTLGVSLGGLLSVGLILLCPLSHLLMMRGMHTGRESRHHGSGRVAGGVVGGEGATPGGGGAAVSLRRPTGRGHRGRQRRTRSGRAKRGVGHGTETRWFLGEG